MVRHLEVEWTKNTSRWLTDYSEVRPCPRTRWAVSERLRAGLPTNCPRLLAPPFEINLNNKGAVGVGIKQRTAVVSKRCPHWSSVGTQNKDKKEASHRAPTNESPTMPYMIKLDASHDNQIAI